MTEAGCGLRIEHVLSFSDAPSIDDHATQYQRLGFVPQLHSARWPPGLRNRFVGLWPEYLELVWVEDEDAFAAGTDPIRAFRAGRRPFGLGIVCDDVPALHEARDRPVAGPVRQPARRRSRGPADVRVPGDPGRGAAWRRRIRADVVLPAGAAHPPPGVGGAELDVRAGRDRVRLDHPRRRCAAVATGAGPSGARAGGRRRVRRVGRPASADLAEPA